MHTSTAAFPLFRRGVCRGSCLKTEEERLRKAGEEEAISLVDDDEEGMAPPPPPSAGGVANLNELLFEALDDEPFVSSLTLVTGELGADAAAAARAEAQRQIDAVPPPPEALEQDLEKLHQLPQRSDSSPQPRQLQPPQRASSGGVRRSGSTSSRGNSGESRRGPERGALAARKIRRANSLR